MPSISWRRIDSSGTWVSIPGSPAHLRARLGLSPTLSPAGVRDRGCGGTTRIRFHVAVGPPRDRDLPAREPSVLARHGKARHAAGRSSPEMHLSGRDDVVGRVLL